MTDKMREDFESWAKSHGYEIDIDKSGFYALHETESGWEAWKASRDSLVIELPKVTGSEFPDWGGGFDCAIEDCQAAVTAAGVKFK